MYKTVCSASFCETKTLLLENRLEEDRAQENASPYGTFGRHIIADLGGCSRIRLGSVSIVKEIMEEAVLRSGATIINSHFHKFSPEGVSGIILLSESHASIHTWPDKGYASIDIYTCGEHVFPSLAVDHICAGLCAETVHVTSLERGLETHPGEYVHRVSNMF